MSGTKRSIRRSNPPAEGCTPDAAGSEAKSHNKSARYNFEAAAALNPTWSRPYTGLAWTYSMDYDFEWVGAPDRPVEDKDFEDTAKKALENANKAVQLDDKDYQAHWALGWAWLYNWDRDKAWESYKRALDLNSNDPDLLAEMANLLIYLDKPKDAVDQLKKAIALNPIKHPKWYIQYLGWALGKRGCTRRLFRRWKQSLVHARNTLGF